MGGCPGAGRAGHTAASGRLTDTGQLTDLSNAQEARTTVADPAQAIQSRLDILVGSMVSALLYGLRDEMVPPDSSQQFHDALQACGATSELDLFAVQIHEFDAAASLCALT